MEKVCQSCGLPLNERILGNENNGTFSQEYCYLCYRNGKFILPNLTMDEMKQQISKIVNQSLENKFQKWLTKTGTLFTIKNVKTLEIVKRLKSILDFNLF